MNIKIYEDDELEPAWKKLQFNKIKTAEEFLGRRKNSKNGTLDLELHKTLRYYFLGEKGLHILKKLCRKNFLRHEIRYIWSQKKV